jgi:predicted nucleotide-binding protein
VVTVEVQAEKWPQILSVMDVFESDKVHAELPQPEVEPPVIFLGHGQSEAWKQLRDHLQDKHGFKIEAYEIGARSGHTIRDILGSMLDRSSMAFLVMTGEDRTESGEKHPRLNVVHEAGLFQGRLGFNRAIVLLEEGTTEFSNIHGVEQIRFTNIKEVFGDVVATVRREFPDR